MTLHVIADESDRPLADLAWIYHDCVEQRSGESVRRLDITQPNENATRRFFCDRL